MTALPEQCAHPCWEWRPLSGDTETRYCTECGELWFRDRGGDWYQRVWTADELAAVRKRVDEWREVFG